MRLIQNHVVPWLSLEDVRVAAGKRVRRDADVEVELVVPTLTQLLPSLGRAVVSEDLEPGEKLFKFHFPVHENTSRHDDQMRTPDAPIARQMGQESNGLDGFTSNKSVNFVRQNKTKAHTRAPSHLQGCS